jgi:8-oxo-dGTP pyrophosphatase MutT (NUDIX family)
MRRVAKGIFYCGNKFLVQQRDFNVNKYPGIWTLFGGNIKDGEEAGDALRRELLEELGYRIGEVEFLFSRVRVQDEVEVEDNIFACEVGEEILDCKLSEGVDMKFVRIDEMKKLDMFEPFRDYVLDWVRVRSCR